MGRCGLGHGLQKNAIVALQDQRQKRHAVVGYREGFLNKVAVRKHDLETIFPGDQPDRREAVRLSNEEAPRAASLSEFPPLQWTLP